MQNLEHVLNVCLIRIKSVLNNRNVKGDFNEEKNFI